METQMEEYEVFATRREKKQINMRFHPALLKQMKKSADRNHRSLNSEFAVAAEQYLQNQDLVATDEE